MHIGGKNAREYRESLIQAVLTNIPRDVYGVGLTSESLEMRQLVDNAQVPQAVLPVPVVPVAQEAAGGSGAPVVSAAPSVVLESLDGRVKLGEKRAFVEDPVDRELEREERRIAIAQKKNALKQQSIDNALRTYRKVYSDDTFDQDLREAAKERALKLVKGMDNGDEDASGM